MITKAIIIDRIVNTNTYTVKVPFLDSAIKEVGSRIATLSETPGVHEAYKPNDVVFVGFEDHKPDKIVILGRLATGEAPARGYATLESLNVADSVYLPKNTLFDGKSLNKLMNKLENLSVFADASGSLLQIQSTKFYATYTHGGVTYTNVLVINFVGVAEPAIIPLDDLIDDNMVKVIPVSGSDKISELYVNNNGEPFVAKYLQDGVYEYYFLGIRQTTSSGTYYAFEADMLGSPIIYMHSALNLSGNTTFSQMINNTYKVEYATKSDLDDVVDDLDSDYVHTNYDSGESSSEYDFYIAIGTNSIIFRAPLYILPVFMKFSNGLKLTLLGPKYIVTGGTNETVTTSMVNGRVNIAIATTGSFNDITLSNFNYQVINNPSDFSISDLPEYLGFVTANYSSSNVNVVFENNVDKKVVNEVSTTGITFTIPSVVQHGFIGCCTFSLGNPPTFSINNQSSFDIDYILNGQQCKLSEWRGNLVSGGTLEVMAECNGINIRIYAKQTIVMAE